MCICQGSRGPSVFLVSVSNTLWSPGRTLQSSLEWPRAVCVIGWLCDGGFKISRLYTRGCHPLCHRLPALLQNTRSVASLGSCHIRSASSCQVSTVAVLGVVRPTSGRIDCTESLKPELFVRSVHLPPLELCPFSFCSPGTQSRTSPHAASTALAFCALSHSLACRELVSHLVNVCKNQKHLNVD